MDKVSRIKNDFPIFSRIPGLVYLDSAATSLRPSRVILKETEYYEQYSANISRGMYPLAEKATQEYESSRKEVASFIGAVKPEEIVFTSGATESLNIAARGLARLLLRKGDRILIPVSEHHSHFVPWQQIAQETGSVLDICGVDEEGKLLLSQIEQKVGRRTKIAALSSASNVLGTAIPVREVTQRIKAKNPRTKVVIDGAQSVPHTPTNVREMGCDLLAFSAHKMLGPTGVGVLWGKEELLKELPPLFFGGHMIEQVTIARTTLREPPYKFEAGTRNIAGVCAFKEAIRYLNAHGMERIREREEELASYFISRVREEFPDIRIFGPRNAKERTGIVSFSHPSIHPHDIAALLGAKNICIRAGHHCTMPLHEALGENVSARVSFALYNEKRDVDTLIKELSHIFKKLS